MAAFDQSRRCRDATGDTVDDMLREALWPEITSRQEERVRAAWRRRTRRRRQKRAAVVAMAVIVSTLALVGYWQRREPRILLAGRDNSNVRPFPRPSSPAEATGQETSGRPQRRHINSEIIARPGNHVAAARFRDRLAVALANRDVGGEQRRLAGDLALLETALDGLTRDTHADAADLVNSLGLNSPIYERRLSELVQRSDHSRRDAVVRLLCCVATPRTVPMLVQLARSPKTHEEATRALARIVGPRTLARLIVMEPSKALQRELLSALAGRDDLMSTRLYLNFVQHPVMSRMALEAIEDATHPPLDQLFSLLRDQRIRVRMAAARTLGHLNDSVVSQRLAEIVLRDPSPHMALAALASSADPVAVQFLAAARHDIALAGPLHAARVRARSWNN